VISPLRFARLGFDSLRLVSGCLYYGDWVAWAVLNMAVRRISPRIAINGFRA